MNMQRFNC